MKKFSLPALLFVLFLTSCGPTVEYVGKTYPATTNVDVYFSPNDVKKEYEVIGKVNGKAYELTKYQAIQDKIVEEAKKRGADGVILSGMDTQVVGTTKNSTTTNSPNQNSSSTTTTTSADTRKVLNADFIKYK